MTEAEKYYSTYTGDNFLRSLNRNLLSLIESENPKSVLEFGCGQGKHLGALKDKGIFTAGVDVSFSNIMHGYCAGNLKTNAILGNENILSFLRGFDVSFTCSVLCHIENIFEITENLKRISPVVILCETSDDVGGFYYPHDYTALGFTEVGTAMKAEGNGCEYRFYKWSRA